MNETRGNSRTKPLIEGGLKGGEINSLKDSEKTNELFNKIFSIIRTICSSIFLITLIIWSLISKNYDFFIIITFTITLGIIISIFFWAYTKAISGK